MVDLVIRGGRVVDAARHVAEPADILIDGDQIATVGAPGITAPADARVIDARGLLMMPGLVNAHTHSHGNLGKGTGDRWTLELLLNAGPSISGHRTVEDKYLSALIGAVEMVRKGCTAAYDLMVEFPVPSPDGLDAVARAYADVGMRAVVAPMIADRTFFQAIPGLFDAVPGELRSGVERLALAPWRETVAAVRKVLDGWKHDRSRIAPAVAPTIPLHCSDEFIVGCRDLAREHDVGIHMHVAESKVQAVAGVQRYGKTLTAHIDSLGLLGPRFTAAHAIWLDDDDIRRLGDRGASAAHNPGSNMRLGSGIARVREMLDRGVNVGVGTDGANCSDNQNVFEAMRLASFASKVQGPDVSRWLTTDQVLTMTTAGGARALGLGDRIGRIAAGYQADIVFLDTAHVNYIPLNDPTNQIVHVEDGTGVHSVMIGGRMVVEAGRVTTVDTSRLSRLAEAAMERLRGANAEARRLATALEPVVNGFCHTLATSPYPVDRYGSRQS